MLYGLRLWVAERKQDLWLWLGRCGWFKHGGLRGCEPHWWPHAYVEYADSIGFYTHSMGVGDAFSYARMFNGTVYLDGTGPRDDKGYLREL